MPAYTWNTGDQITAVRLNSVAASLSTVATTGSYSDLTNKPNLPSASAWVFSVSDYGAVGNGTTDDTTAIRAALAAAVTYAQANNHYAELLFLPKTYAISGALVQGGATKGNAQIPLPFIAGNTPKITIVFRGVGEPPNNHWNATTPQTTGTVLRSTLLSQAYSATYGLPSVIGAPTPEQSGYGAGGITGAVFSNICVVVDGIQLQVPSNPTVCGWDLRGAAAARVISGSAFSQDLPSTWAPGNAFSTALLMPLSANNDYAEVGQWTAFGWYCAIAISEHAQVTSMRAICCSVGIRVLGPYPHSAIINHASVEACVVAAVQYVDIGGVPFSSIGGARVRINLLDIEGVSYIDDAGTNRLFGEIYISNEGSPISVNAANVRVIDLDTFAGAVTAPNMPTSTTALQNPFWRDCAVSITGGTVTGISVAGQSLGVTSGTVFVPSGKSIAVTYSAAPTWKWTAL